MKNIIVTIGREFGTGGRQIAVELSKLLGVNVYDRRLLDELKEKYHLTTEELDIIKSEKKSWWNDFITFYKTAVSWNDDSEYNTDESVNSLQLYNDEKRILQALAEKESCIILGRTGFHIFKDNPNAVKIFLIADMPYRRDRVGRRLNIGDGNADLLIKKVDEARENFTQTFSGKSRYDAHNYDLVINVTNLQPQQVAQIIAQYIENTRK